MKKYTRINAIKSSFTFKAGTKWLFFCSFSGSNSASNVWAGSSLSFLLWVFKRLLTGTQPLPLYVPSPVKNVTPESLGDSGRKCASKFPLLVRPSYWPAASTGTEETEHGGDGSGRSSAIKHLQLCKVFFRSWLGAQFGWPPLTWKTPKPPQCLELNDPYFSRVMLAFESAAAAGGVGTLEMMPETDPRKDSAKGIQCQLQEQDFTRGTYSTLDKVETAVALPGTI